ncbi:MAG TPA: DUF2490 domain-containing protein [Spirochaetes bacterium]|nr:DUF2490 domain-containing protein [Spirochaetota bacterium]
MNIKLFCIIISILATTGTAFSLHVPFNHPNRKQSFALQQDLRLFYKVTSHFKLLFEGQMKESLTTSTTGTPGTGNSQPSSNQKFPEILAFRVGGLYRLQSNLKIGAYYQLHNRRNHHTGRLNSEHVPMVDIVPRFKLSSRFVAELRLRNELNINTGSGQGRITKVWYTIKIRPKITYFLIEDAEFKLGAFFAYEIYIPVNYGSDRADPFTGEIRPNGMMEHWLYTGLVLPFTEKLSLNPYYALRFNRSGGDHTAAMTHIVGLGLTLNI